MSTRRFFTGRQALEFYIPDYGKESQIRSMEEEIEVSITKILSKIDLYKRFSTPAPSKSEPKEVQ